MDMMYTRLSMYLRQYRLIQLALYSAVWLTCFLLVMILATFSPRVATWVLKLTSPISNAIMELFWVFIPEGGQVVRPLAKLLGKIGEGAMRMMGPNAQLVLTSVLNGFLTITLFAVIFYIPIWSEVRKRLILKFLEQYRITPRLEGNEMEDA